MDLPRSSRPPRYHCRALRARPPGRRGTDRAEPRVACSPSCPWSPRPATPPPPGRRTDQGRRELKAGRPRGSRRRWIDVSDGSEMTEVPRTGGDAEREGPDGPLPRRRDLGEGRHTCRHRCRAGRGRRAHRQRAGDDSSTTTASGDGSSTSADASTGRPQHRQHGPQLPLLLVAIASQLAGEPTTTTTVPPTTPEPTTTGRRRPPRPRRSRRRHRRRRADHRPDDVERPTTTTTTEPTTTSGPTTPTSEVELPR